MRSRGSSRNRRGSTKLYAAPGNPGIAEHAELVALDRDRSSRRWSISAARRRSAWSWSAPKRRWSTASPTTCAPTGIAVFGPSKAAAQLEGSKGFTKDLCAARNIPTAGYRARHRSRDAARGGARRDFGLPVVIKADGLAAGKGVIIADDDGRGARRRSTTICSPAAAAPSAVIEEFLTARKSASSR